MPDPRLTLRTWLVGYGDNCYHHTSPALLMHRLVHIFMGRRRGCSCSKCFCHPRRRVPPQEIMIVRARLSELEDRVRRLEWNGRKP